MKRRFAPLLSFLLPLCLWSQDLINVEGKWYGNSTFLKTNYEVLVDIDQQGSQLKGTLMTRTLSGKDSSLVEFKGLIEDQEVKFFPVKFIYKTWGGACMSNLILNFSENENEDALVGKWKGDLKLSTCPPGVSGTTQVYRTKPKINLQISSAMETRSIAADDEIGNVLVTELNKRRYHALLIGIEEYGDDEIETLEHPIDDALKLAKVLIENYSFEEGDITVLKNAKREEIIEALDDLAGKVKETDNVLLFYAGHGIWNGQLNQGYWLPSDASMSSKSYWLSNSTIRDYLGGIRSKHTLLISDACFSGGILKERGVFENSRAILELYKLPSRKAITSGTLKTVPDESVFMKYLLKGLVENDAPLLSADQLFRQFKIAVINNSPNGQVPQYGPITQAGDEGGDFIFLKGD